MESPHEVYPGSGYACGRASQSLCGQLMPALEVSDVYAQDTSLVWVSCKVVSDGESRGGKRTETMDFAVTDASHILNRLRRQLIEVFVEDVDGLLDELTSLYLISPEEYLNLNAAESPVKKTENVLNLILVKGEPACEKFLKHLENMILRFPKLQNLSGHFPENKRTDLEELLVKLEMERFAHSKLTLKRILNIGKENITNTDPQNIQDIPWHFLKKLLALNRSARNIQCKKNTYSQASDIDINTSNDLFKVPGFSIEEDRSHCLHPLDVLCVLLHCSDNFLQQEIVAKMSMCQFAVPLLLPIGDRTNCTFMLWAMRDIVKRWRPHSLADRKGFKEDNVVNISMPTFSFVRLGKTKLSKSKILNQVLSPAQQYHDFFIHDNMEGGNIERKLSNGLVEMSWYFPSGSESSDIFPEPIAVTNLRGDLESNLTQFIFLTRVSSAVFIFIKHIGEREFRLLSNCDNKDTKYYIIITPSPGTNVNKETLQNLQNIMSKLQLVMDNIIIKTNTDNDTALMKKIQLSINCFLNDNPKITDIRNMEKQIIGLDICVDETSNGCCKAKEIAEKITKEIRDVSQYKKESLILQGDLWKQISIKEKEMCRMKNQGHKDAQKYLGELRSERTSLHKTQYGHSLPSGLMQFTDAIVNLSPIEKHFFLKWMKLDLDLIARVNLSDLQANYKEKCNSPLDNQDELKQLDQKISDSSLGIEHFLREMGQFYEAEFSMVNEEIISKDIRQFTRLPGIAADLLLDGFPLELIDGDASNIPLQWITDVLTELDTKTGGQCRMRVITVLGVQSTGKSTLLNTMFGLQFPVASGRCTRGAFMTFIKVEDDFQEELGCDFILVIDTEGLKAPELASLEDSYEHDNELATLVVGLSDITIINMSMENIAEMKDILQIVVHAFLRMKEIGKKPKCQFVHQNVSDVSAHEKNMRDRKKLLEQLDEMTNIATKMEKKHSISKFCDVMDYDTEKDSWYIPGLWHGVPPMAPVNYGYSEKVSELKMFLADNLKTQNSSNKPLNIKEFIEWIKSLWNAVKYEKFIFSFRNSVFAEAYNKLSMQFSQWEWDFTKAVHSWVINTETLIRNQTADTLNTERDTHYEDELQKLLCQEESKMSELLGKYFENKSENVHLIEKYKEEFFMKVKFLKNELERNALYKCREAYHIQKLNHKIRCIQVEYQRKIECRVTDLLRSCRELNHQLSDKYLEDEFNTMWENTSSALQIEPLQRRNISQTILLQLQNEMSLKGSDINKKLLNVISLEEYGKKEFQMRESYVDPSWLSVKQNKLYIIDHYDKISQLGKSLIEISDGYVTEKVNTRLDYDDTYFQELLQSIDFRLQNQDVRGIHFSSIFELDIKLLIFGRATQAFQKMHEEFIQENDPKICLEKLKSKYFSTFLTIYHEKDQSQHRAKLFCELCLKPALTKYIFNQLGKEIVDDILKSSDNKIFNSRSFFQAAVLKDLLEKEDFHNILKYIKEYPLFVKDWILKFILGKYKKPSQLETLQTNILSTIVKQNIHILSNEEYLTCPNIANFLENICEKLNHELIIPQYQINMVTFSNNVNVDQFSKDVKMFISETENQILSKVKRLSIETILTKVTSNPVDELLKKVMGCGKQCPFCKVPCEAGGTGHTEHFASIHRPQGLRKLRWDPDDSLAVNICSTSVVSSDCFWNCKTGGKHHSYKEYRTFYPDWAIQPDPSIQSSDYWKYIFVKFNKHFAIEYGLKPAKLPEEWKQISKEQALRSLKEVFNMN
ncbi:interferon-induced very large GTPase 1-like [Pelobates fuscus]|uniref:interferon-induced very large GTPase 1-like n=1 Tax=Pelobates fuscus TaxID=191477 RepID=UPI002FE44CE6